LPDKGALALCITALEALTRQLGDVVDGSQFDALAPLLDQRDQVIARLHSLCGPEGLAEYPELAARLELLLTLDQGHIDQIMAMRNVLRNELQQADHGRVAVSAYSNTWDEPPPAHYLDTDQLN
jgi:hypothetical protein